MSRVYIPQMPLRKVEGQLVPAYDVSSAGEHGELVELVGSSAKPWDKSVIYDIAQKLENSSPDDFILMVGSPVMCAIAVGIMADMNDGLVKMLQWHGYEQRYNLVEVRLWAPSFDCQSPTTR